MAAQYFYVRKSGNDSNGGTSKDDAFLTIQHAADNMNPASGTPIYCYIGAGIYEKAVMCDTYAGTDDDNRIIYIGDIDGSHTDDDGDVILEGGAINGIALRQDWLTGRNLIARNCGQNGFDGRADGVNFINCVGYDCGGTNQSGLYIKEGYTDGKIYNCTSFSNARGITVQADNTEVRNCIAYNNSSFQFGCGYGGQDRSTLTLDNNDWSKGSGDHLCVNYTTQYDYYDTLADWQTFWDGVEGKESNDDNSVSGDPLFVDEEGKDFHIEDNDSPCFGVGEDLSALFTDDYDGDTRVYWDIGADYIATVGYTISIGSGSFTETGQTVNLLKDSKISISAGSFIETGQTVSLLKGFNLVIGAGTFVWTGFDVTLTKKEVEQYILSALAGEFVLSGFPALLRIADAKTGWSEERRPTSEWNEEEKLGGGVTWNEETKPGDKYKEE